MEILHFCPSRSFSGLEQYAFDLALDQKKRGKDVGFVVSPGTQLQKHCERNEIKTVVYDPFQLLASIRFWPKLFKIIMNQKDLRVIHLHSTQELNHVFGGVLLAKLKSTPKIILQTHIWINHAKKDLYHKLLYSIVDEVWCSSAPAKKALEESFPIDPNKIKIINYGRDVEHVSQKFLSREEARLQLGLPQELTLLGCVSRLEPSKGIREFLDAVSPLLKENSNLGVAIIGGPSPKNPEAERYAEDLRKKNHERVFMLGAVPESYRYLKAFDLYVLPSYEECFSLSLLDAQLAGLPVIGSNSGGTPEIVIEGQTGWLFSPKNVDELRQKIQEALEKKSVWSIYGEKSSRRVQKEYNQKNVFNEVIKGYTQGL